MPTQAGGGGRFQNAGSLWKSSWKGHALFKQVCCFDGFSTAPGGEFYVEPGGALPLVPAAGFFVGALVGLEAVPLPTPGTIARNGGPAAEGWILDVIDAGLGDVRFRFTVFDGAGVAAQVVQGGAAISLANVGGGFGDPAKIFMPVLAGFIPPAAFGPDGAIFLVTPSVSLAFLGEVTGGVPLTAPYVNSSPSLTVGVGLPGEDLRAPNCIQGLVGGVAPWDAAFVTRARDIYDQWYPQIDTENRVVLLPESTPVVPITNTNGWRADSDNGNSNQAAPNPLAPFVGAPSLVYGGAGPPALLGQDCASPMRLSPANLRFPFA